MWHFKNRLATIIFHEFGTFSITDWIEWHTIKPLPAKNFECLQMPRTRFSKVGREWRIDSTRFPISTTVTGVMGLDLEPGVLREASLASQRR